MLVVLVLVLVVTGTKRLWCVVGLRLQLVEVGVVLLRWLLLLLLLLGVMVVVVVVSGGTVLVVLLLVVWSLRGQLSGDEVSGVHLSGGR